MTALELFVINHPLWVYAILFGGMFIEGEAFFLTIAIFALQGLLSWPLVLLVTFVGVILGDLTWYALGKYSRNTKLGFLLSEKFNIYHQWLENNFLDNYERMAIYSKFLYYINRLAPLIAGWHNFELKKFFRIHLYAAIFWLGVMSTLGSALAYVVGPEGIQWMLKRIEWVFIGSLLIFLVIEYSLKRVFSKKISRTLER